MSTVTGSRPVSPVDVVAMQYAVPTRMVTVPLGILVGVVLVMIAVTWAVVRGGASAADLDDDGVVVWSLFGFLVAVGVQSVSVPFPLALALGTTRRAFALGVLATAVLESSMLAAAGLLLLGIERATGGWFMGARVLGDTTLGAGNPLLLVAIMFGLSLTALSVGALYGASFLRFGAGGPAVVGLVSAALLSLLLLVVLPALPGIAAAVGGGYAIVAAVLVAVSTVGEYLLLRSASVR